MIDDGFVKHLDCRIISFDKTNLIRPRGSGPEVQVQGQLHRMNLYATATPTVAIILSL